jgi:hypothetical protein
MLLVGPTDMLSVGPTSIEESIKASIIAKTRSTNMLVQAFYIVHNVRRSCPHE